MRIIFATFLLAAALQAAAAQTILKQEPKEGALKHGTVVLVDDGSCPAGQIKEVAGGRDDGPNRTKRTRRCVPKK